MVGWDGCGRAGDSITRKVITTGIWSWALWLPAIWLWLIWQASFQPTHHVLFVPPHSSPSAICPFLSIKIPVVPQGSDKIPCPKKKKKKNTMPFMKPPEVSLVERKSFSHLKLHIIWILLQLLSCSALHTSTLQGLPQLYYKQNCWSQVFYFLKSQRFKLTADMQKEHLWPFSPWFCLNQYFYISPTPDKERVSNLVGQSPRSSWCIFYEGQCALMGHHLGVKLPSSQPGPLISPLLSVCLAGVLTWVQSPLPPSLPPSLSLPPTPWLSTQVLNSDLGLSGKAR